MSITTVFDFVDPHVDGDLDRISARVEELTAMGFHGDPGVDLLRRRRRESDATNPATIRLRADVEGLDAWLSLIPTASALDPLYEPTAATLPSGAPITASMRPWLRNLADARGIRSRAAAFSQLADRHARTNPDGRWVSLACGAAHPVVRTLGTLRRDGIRPRADFVDLDPWSLRLAEQHAHDVGVRHQVSTYRMNVLGLGGVAPANWLRRIRKPVTPGYALVESLGLLEYLRADDWRYHYDKVARYPRTMAGAITFLRNAWALVAPGGLLVVSNMLDTHPQLGFTLNVVQWPHIQPRSVLTMREIFAAAGLPDDVEIILPADGVYAVYAFRKHQ